MVVCQKLVEAGLAESCESDSPAGLGAAASGMAVAKLTKPAGERAQVLVFDSADAYEKTEKAFDDAAALAGPHRYGNASKRVFVQANEGLSKADGKKLRGIVEAL
jgi:hypothetical protein